MINIDINDLGGALLKNARLVNKRQPFLVFIIKNKINNSLQSEVQSAPSLIFGFRHYGVITIQ